MADLRALFDAAIAHWWDPDAHAAVLAAEDDDRRQLADSDDPLEPPG